MLCEIKTFGLPAKEFVQSFFCLALSNAHDTPASNSLVTAFYLSALSHTVARGGTHPKTHREMWRNGAHRLRIITRGCPSPTISSPHTTRLLSNTTHVHNKIHTISHTCVKHHRREHITRTRPYTHPLANKAHTHTHMPRFVKECSQGERKHSARGTST